MKHICTDVVLKLGQPVDTLSVVGSSSVTGAGGRVLDAEAVIVNISNRIRSGGDVDWVMPLYSALLLGSHITIVSSSSLKRSLFRREGRRGSYRHVDLLQRQIS